MAKTGNFNVNIDEKTAKEFNLWSEKTPGKKFEHITGALKAIQAIYNINKELAIELMNPNLSITAATKLVKRKITDSYLRGWMNNFPEEKRRQIVEDARRAEEKISQK